MTARRVPSGPTLGGRVRYLKTSEAAALLNVSPNTLRAWERRFGFPKPQRSPGKHRLYTYGEIAAPARRAAGGAVDLLRGLTRTRRALRADADTLVGVLARSTASAPTSAMESALALRSLDRVVEEVLLPSLDELGRRHGHDSARMGLRVALGERLAAARSAAGTAPGAACLAPDRRRDARRARPRRSTYLRALELLCARAGATILPLSVRGVSGHARTRSPPCAPTSSSSPAASRSRRRRRTLGLRRAVRGRRRADGALPPHPTRNARAHDRTRTLPDQASAAQRELLHLVESTRIDQRGRTPARLRRSRRRRSPPRRVDERCAPPPHRGGARNTPTTLQHARTGPSAATAAARLSEPSAARVCDRCGLGRAARGAPPTSRRRRATRS